MSADERESAWAAHLDVIAPYPVKAGEGDSGSRDRGVAYRAGFDAGWDAARRPAPVEVVSSVEELDALPVGTLIEVGYTQPDGHVVTTQVLRIEHGDGGAASGGASLRGGRFWTQVWGWADSIRVLFRPDREEKN